jgi:hypothetical protein
VVGQTERFSVLLSGQPHTWLTYILHYPDGHEEHIPVRTDSHGYASYTFRVLPYQARHFRDTGAVGVEDANGRVLAFTRLAIQSPGLHAQATRTSTVNPDPAITALGLAVSLAVGLAVGLAILAIGLSRPSD